MIPCMDIMSCETENGIGQKVKNIHLDCKAQESFGGGGKLIA